MQSLLSLFPNKPVSTLNRSWFVNRESHMQRIQDIARYDEGNIYGISSQRGSGKTSLINLIEEKSFRKLLLNLTERTTRESIYCDMIMGLCGLMKNARDLRKYRKELFEIEEFLSYEITKISRQQLGASAVIEASLTKGTTSEDRFNIYTLKKKLARVLSILASSKHKYVIFIDEIDKESRNEIIKLLDSIKHVLWTSNFTVFFTLPYSIYKEFLRDRARSGENGNLDNIFQDIIHLKSLDERSMYDIVLTRAGDTNWIERKALNLVIKYASGNPRDLILTMHNAILHNLNESMLKTEYIVDEIKEVLQTYIASLRLSESENTFLSLVTKKRLMLTAKSTIAKSLSSEMPRSTVYECFKSLSSKNLLKSVDPFNIKARLALWYENFVPD